MKAKLEFDLPQEADEYKSAINGGKYIAAIQNFDNYLRNELKHQECHTLEQRWDTLNKLRDKLHEICEDFTIWS